VTPTTPTAPTAAPTAAAGSYTALSVARLAPHERALTHRKLRDAVVHATRRLDALDAFPGDPLRASAELTVAAAGKVPAAVPLDASTASSVITVIRPKLELARKDAARALDAFEAALAELNAEAPPRTEPEPGPDADADPKPDAEPGADSEDDPGA
jgi:hypothetical protein